MEKCLEFSEISRFKKLVFVHKKKLKFIFKCAFKVFLRLPHQLITGQTAASVSLHSAKRDPARHRGDLENYKINFWQINPSYLGKNV